MSEGRRRGLQKPPRTRAPADAPDRAPAHPVADWVARDDAALLVPLNRIRVNPGQPRRTFSEESLAELAEDIRANGLINAITVTRDGEAFVLVAGERRLRALRLMGAQDAPVRIVPREFARAIQLAENIHREDLPLLEEAQALADLQAELGLTVRQLADYVRKSKSYVHRRLEVLKWPQDAKEALRARPELFTRIAAIAGIADDSERKRHLAALAGDPSSQAPEPRSGRPKPSPQPIAFRELKGGGFDLQVRYRPGVTDRESLIADLKRLLKELEQQG